MILFAVETFAAVCDEIRPLWQRHWEEIGEDRHAIQLDPDAEAYHALDSVGRLLVVTARREGALVGYVFALVSPHLHYRSTIFANLDLYYVAPEHRGGRTAWRMFLFLEQALKDRGVRKMVGNTKLRRDHGRLFEALGWRAAETIFTKVI